jgi:tryptophanyl-tRNA synthetase
MHHPRRVFSGIQPTGRLTLGNYVGAIRNWVRLQEEEAPPSPSPMPPLSSSSSSPSPPPPLLPRPSPSSIPRPRDTLFFSIADLHAMTVPYRPEELRSGSRSMAASLLACGLDPSRVVLFQQSRVRQHTELAWLFSCATPLGWLQRMTQFKQKGDTLVKAARLAAKGAKGPAQTGKEDEGPGAVAGLGTGGTSGGGDRPSGPPLGLLSYPVLQAADILLYRATHVPVGEDQRQHLELARDIAAAFNSRFSGAGSGGAPQDASASAPAPATGSGTGLLPLPQTLSLPVGARVMSLRDGRSKMSKSDPHDDSRINLDDSADDIARKIKGAKTDGTPGFTYSPEARPEKANLLAVYAALCPETQTPEAAAARFADASAQAFKGALTELLVARLGPIGREMRRLEGDPAYVDGVLAAGAEAARGYAEESMVELRRVAGYD